MSMRDLPIQRKLMRILLGTCIVVMLLMRGSFFAYEYLTFRQATVRQVDALGAVLAANSTAALAFENREDAGEILSALKAERHITGAAIYDRHGHLFAHYPESAATGTVPPQPGPDDYQFGEAGLELFRPILQRDRRLGTLYLRFDTSAVLSQFLWGSLKIAVAVMVVVLLLAYLLARRLQRQISHPILALAETARSVSERGDYSRRAPVHGRDEVGQLTEDFNRMLGRIDELNRELERRVADRTAQLEVANKELEAFSYSVSHDLRAPLRHIDGFAGLLRKSDGAALSDKGRGHLNHIAASAKQMGALIDDLLVFARMGRNEMRIGPVDLGKLAEETKDGLAPELQSRRVDWRIGPLPVVQGDPPMLRQVFVNLLSNAVKYSRPRDPAVIEIQCHEENGEHVVQVRDNGVGFEMQYADKLFGVFQRLHRAEDFEGTGIGLANVRRIVSRHGGRTWAESQPDAGATFSFTLPKNRPSSP